MSEISGLPLYGYDPKANAEDGIRMSTNNSFKSTPEPGTDKYVEYAVKMSIIDT